MTCTFMALKGINGNGYYDNCEIVDLVDEVRFHNSYNESDTSTFTTDLVTLYDAGLVFSDAMPDITANSSALLNSFSSTFQSPDDIITLVRHSKHKLTHANNTLNKACLLIERGKEIVGDFEKGVLDCMTQLRNTPIPDGTPGFKDIYNQIIVFLTSFQDNLQKVDGVTDQTIKDSVHNFLTTVLQPSIDSANLNQPYETYHTCFNEKTTDVEDKLKDVLKDLQDLLHVEPQQQTYVAIYKNASTQIFSRRSHQIPAIF